jgi:lipopolysaccharide/colanic/teichoic acid biosynthesis glycosyltransferase
MTPFVIRLLDVVGAAALLVLMGFPMLLIAAMIRAHDGGSALFSQVRVGRDGRHFKILKFRSMSVDRSGSGLGTIGESGESLQQANSRFQRTIPGDPRITPIGRILRPSHLDELPQLLNILRGDMSFVGVRPDTPVQEADYTAEYWRRRHLYRPGLTGPAQLRSDPLNFAQRNAEETRWLEGYGIRMYLATLAATVGKVLTRTSY